MGSAAPQKSTTSVTELLDAKSKDSSKASAPTANSVEAMKKALIGVDVHRLFENLKYHFMNDADFDWKELLKNLSPSHEKALRFLAEDHQGRWLNLIRRGEVEWGFAVQSAGGLIQGQIDLWSMDEAGTTWIVDYKTGNPQHVEKALDQLKIYSWALQKMKELGPQEDPDIHLVVLYPFAKKTVIEKSPSLAELESWLTGRLSRV